MAQDGAMTLPRGIAYLKLYKKDIVQTDMGLRIKLLGQFEVYRDGRSIAPAEWRTEKNKDLLKVLALHPDEELSQDWLMEALWPDQDPERSVRNLRGRISEIRRILEPTLSQGSESAYVKTVSNGYRFDSAHCRIDTRAFEASYRQAIARSELDVETAIQGFRRASEIYLGELLPADRHKDWTFERRDELRRLYLDGLRQLTELFYQSQRYDEAIRYGEKALHHDPYDERVYRTLMRSHHEMGNAHAALRLYERCRRALEGSDMEPSEATQHLFETMRHQAYRFSEQISIEDQLQRIAERLSTEDDVDERWDLLGQQVEHLHTLGRGAQEADALDVAENLARSLNDPGKIGRVFIKRSAHERATGHLDAAEHHAQQALERFEAIDDPLGLAEAHYAFGRCRSARQDVHGAHEHYERALRQLHALDGVRADQIRIRTWTRLGQMAVLRQRYDEALAYFDQAMRLSQAIEDYAEQARLFLRLGSLHYYRDCVAEAQVHWEHGRQLAHRIGHQAIEVKCLANLAVLKKNQADLTSAWGLYETVLDIQERLNDVDGLAKSWNNLGVLHDALGRVDEALAAFELARQYSERIGDDLGAAIEEMSVASVQIRREHFDEAEARLTQALSTFRAHEDAWYEVQALYYLGELELARAQPLIAKNWLDKAHEIAQRIGSRKLAEHIGAALAATELSHNRGKSAVEWAHTVDAALSETPPGIEDTRVFYRLYRVFQEAGMAERADRHLRKAHELVDRLASQLTDPTELDALQRVPLYRAIIDAYRGR